MCHIPQKLKNKSVTHFYKTYVMQLHHVKFIKTDFNVQILCLTLQNLISCIDDGHLMDATIIQIPVCCTSHWAYNSDTTWLN